MQALSYGPPGRLPIWSMAAAALAGCTIIVTGLALVTPVLVDIARSIFAMLIWPYENWLSSIVAVGFWLGTLALLRWAAKRWPKLAFVLSVCFVALVAATAPAFRVVPLENGYTVLYFNTPDGDLDRDHVQIIAPDGTITSETLEHESTRCWPTVLRSATTLSFSCSKFSTLDKVIDLQTMRVVPNQR